MLLDQRRVCAKCFSLCSAAGEAHQKAAQSVAVKPLSQAVCVVNKMFHLQSAKKSACRCVKMRRKKWRVVMSKNRTAESTHSNWVFNEMKGFCRRRSTLSVQCCWSVSKGVKSEVDHLKLCINRPFGRRSVQKSSSAQSSAVNYKSGPGAVLESQTFQGLIVSSRQPDVSGYLGLRGARERTNLSIIGASWRKGR